MLPGDKSSDDLGIVESGIIQQRVGEIETLLVTKHGKNDPHKQSNNY